MKKEMMDIICCPICKNDIVLTIIEEDKEDIISGDLYCQKCDTHYPIENSVPDMRPINIRISNSKQHDIQKSDIQKPLKIGIISTPFFTLPPKGYSGLEQIVWDLAEALDELGHYITLFAPEGSELTKNGHLIVTGPSVSTVNVDWFEEEKKRYNTYKDIITPENFDIIIDHTWFAFIYLSKIDNPKLKVMHIHHGYYTWDSPPPITKPNLVAISQWMRSYTEQYFQKKNFNIGCQYAYNCVNLDKYTFDQNIKKTDRLLYIGRFSKFKGTHIAIQIAKKSNLPIDLIGGTFIDDINYLKEIECMCNGDKIVIYKDAPHDFKIKKLQEAKALLVPSRFHEPFGLVCIEGMACGTPIIATRDGALPEIILDGKTGYICNNEDDMIKAVKNIDKIDPLLCTKRAKNFSRPNMAKRYDRLCRMILSGNEW